MNIEIIAKVADLIIKGGILTTLAYGIKKLASTPKQITETANVVVAPEARADEVKEDND